MLSIIIPTKNEPYLQQLIDDIGGNVKTEHEIIVVDKSATTPVVSGARLIRQKSDGLGNAFVEGLKEANGDMVVIMDGDGSHDPAYISEMLGHSKDYDIVVGSKFADGGSSEDTASRAIVSKAFGSAIGALLGLKIKDPMSGFALFRRSVFNGLDLRPRGYKIVLEIMYKSSKRGARIKEIAIRFQKRKAGESKVGFNISGLKEAYRIFLLALSLKTGKG